MLVLIDGNGCPGFKAFKGSTLYFVLAMVIFEKFLDAEIVSKKITDLRAKLNLRSEFKFSKTKDCYKEKLFTYLRQELGPGKIKKFSFADSSKDNLIQLADMVAGAIARSYKDNRSESKKWITVLRKNGQLANV